MNFNLFVETITNGYKLESLFVLSLVSIFFGVSIITTKNPVVSVLYLIGLFVTISLYLMLIGLHFIGLSYLLVYVGAVSILFLFILMLINVRTSELLTEGKNSIPLAIITVLCFNFTVNNIIPYNTYILDTLSKYIVQPSSLLYKKTVLSTDAHVYESALSNNNNNILSDNLYSSEISNVTSKLWESHLVESNHITSIGNILYTEMFMFLIITAFILLLAMVGTIVMTAKKRN